MINQQVIVISGGSSGIGKALVTYYISKGALVSTCSRNITQLQDALKHLPVQQLYLRQLDVTQREECENWIKDICDKWGRIDILINNAGMSMRALFEEVEIDVLKKLMDVNFWGSVYCTKAALPVILKNKGVIVGISSIAGYRGLPGRTGYSASKFALQGFLEALRTELLYTGVHVMWVSPGFTESNIRNAALNNKGVAQKETPLNEKKLMSAATVAERIALSIQHRKRTVVMTRQGKLAVWINKLWPSFADKKVFAVFAKEADSPLKKQIQPKH